MTDTETELDALLCELLEMQAKLAELDTENTTIGHELAATVAEANDLRNSGDFARAAGDTVRDPE